MIVGVVVSGVFLIVTWILNIIGNFISFPAGSLTTAVNFVSEVLDKGCGLLFFMIRPATFSAAVDILFFMHMAVPLYNFVMWVLRKIPFINIE